MTSRYSLATLVLLCLNLSRYPGSTLPGFTVGPLLVPRTKTWDWAFPSELGFRGTQGNRPPQDGRGRWVWSVQLRRPLERRPVLGLVPREDIGVQEESVVAGADEGCDVDDP